jgi:DNA-binding response OmpR family regulator
MRYEPGPPPDSPAVLLVEDDQSIRDVLVELFDVNGTDVTAVATLDDAKQALGRRTYDLIVTDLNLAGKRDGGLQVMAAAGLLSTDAPIIVLTAFPDEANRSASHRLGATYFLEKPADLAAIATLATRHGVRTAMTGEG